MDSDFKVYDWHSQRVLIISKVNLVKSNFSELSLDYDWKALEVTLLKPFSYQYVSKKECILVTAYQGFVSNGLSIPEFLWPIYGHPLDRKNIRAAIIHDYLYRHHIFSRRKADIIFYYSLLEDRTTIEAYSLFAGVRVFGHIPFERNKVLTLPTE